MNENKFDTQHVVYYQVSKDDLPFCCPPKDKKNDLNHPKVFLNFDDKNKATCEYCGAFYVFK